MLQVSLMLTEKVLLEEKMAGDTLCEKRHESAEGHRLETGVRDPEVGLRCGSDRLHEQVVKVSIAETRCLCVHKV